MVDEKHWQDVYSRKAAGQMSWYKSRLERSLEFIRSAGLSPDARIVDIGGGASTLVDDLLSAGYRNVAVADLANAALQVAQERLGAQAAAVEWIAGDVTTPLLPDASVDFWHDRAVFHFLGDVAAREAYVVQLTRCLKPGAYVLIATFALGGPEKCSGLPVTRYDADGIHAALGPAFEKLGEAAEEHRTPSGATQSFTYCFGRSSPSTRTR